MSTDRFEDFLRDELSSYPDDQSADDLWLNIERELDQEKKKKRPFFFWLLFLGLLLPIGLACFLLWPSSSDGNKQTKLVDAPLTVQPSPNTATASDEATKLPAPDASAIPSNTSKTIEERTKKKTPLLANTASPPFEASKKTKQKTTASRSEQRPLPSAQRNKSSQQLTPTTPLSLATSKQDDEAPKQRQLTLQPLTPLPSVNWQIEATPRLSNMLALKKPLGNVQPQEPNAALSISPSPDKLNGYWAIQAEGGINSLNWQYKSKAASNENYADFRNDTENGIAGFQAGLSLRRVGANGWSWKSGLSYQENWVKASFQQSVMDSVRKENVLIRLLIDPRTDEVVDSIYGNATVARSREETFIHHNSFRYLQIPFSVGYEWGTAKQKLSFGFEAGMGLNIWWQRKGVILGENLERIQLEDDASPTLSTAGLFISTQFSPVVRYRLSSKFSVFLRPFIDISWSDWMNDNSPLSNRPIQTNLNMGASYQL